MQLFPAAPSRSLAFSAPCPFSARAAAGRERALALPFKNKGKVAALRALTNLVLPGDIGRNGVLPGRADQPQGGDLVKHAGENNMATGAGLEMQVDHQGNSPTKRRAPDKQEDLALNIDIIREAIRGELKDALSDVKQDLRSFATRVDNVENQVTRKMQQTINLLDDMTTKYASHGDILQQLQEANKEVNLRLERLEKGGGASSVAGSTAASDNSRRPALIVGGWDPDQDAATTKEAAMDVLKAVEAPIALDSMFVPGVRRGYAIVPIDDRLGEHFEQRKQRIQDVIAKVREANIQLGRRPDGGTKRVWIAMSQPPDRRRRARLAAKVKRLYLTLGGNKDALQMEFSTGTAWVDSVKVSSATAPKPGRTEDAGPGWVNLAEIAKATRTTQQAVSAAWSPLKAEIN
ncbi:PLRG1 [Symbiodinium sp. CCMP2592]|nr:PLRG1 [Symbiodinium sp. CCMP2592]